MSLLVLFVKKVNLICFFSCYLFIKNLLTGFSFNDNYDSTSCKFINNWLIKFLPDTFYRKWLKVVTFVC